MDEEEIKNASWSRDAAIFLRSRGSVPSYHYVLRLKLYPSKKLGIFKWEFYNGMQHCDTSYALTANQKLLNCKYLMEIIWSHIWKYQAVFLSYTPANGSAVAKKHARHSMLPANVALSWSFKDPFKTIQLHIVYFSVNIETCETFFRRTTKRIASICCVW